MKILGTCLHLGFFLFLMFSTARSQDLIGQEAGQNAAPSMPLKLPDNVSWVNTVIGAKEDGTRGYLRHVFIARGKKWRLETEMFNKPPVIIIFDGKSMGSNIDFQKSKLTEQKSPQFWDARTIIKMN